MVLFTTPAAAELSVWRSYFGCGHFISFNVCLVATISCAVMNIAPSLASEAEEMTNLIFLQVLVQAHSIGACRHFQKVKYELQLCFILCFHCEILRLNARRGPYR